MHRCQIIFFVSMYIMTDNHFDFGITIISEHEWSRLVVFLFLFLDFKHIQVICPA